MHLGTKIRYQFEVSSKELSHIIRALKKNKSIALATKIAEQRSNMAEKMSRDMMEALNMCIELESEISEVE